MAFIKTKKEKTEKTAAHVSLPLSLESVIVRPRITEKATFKAGENTYVFDISPDANKKKVSAAIQKIYSVVPRKISITRIPSKTTFVRGKKGVKSGGKKAYVYLKAGDKIEII